MAEVAEFMSESSGEDSEQPPSTTMANFQIPPPDILVQLANSSNWVSSWNNYRLATKLDKEEEARQVGTLLAVIGKEANKVFRTFTWASPDDAKKVAAVVSKFEEYCIPRENAIYERFLFFIRGNLKLLINQYLTELRQIAANCDFESITPVQLLRDRQLPKLVTSTKTAKVGENLLKEKKLILEKVIDIPRDVERDKYSFMCPSHDCRNTDLYSDKVKTSKEDKSILSSASVAVLPKASDQRKRERFHQKSNPEQYVEHNGNVYHIANFSSLQLGKPICQPVDAYRGGWQHQGLTFTDSISTQQWSQVGRYGCIICSRFKSGSGKSC